MSEDVGILVFIGGAFAAVVVMIAVVARLARSAGKAKGQGENAATDDDDNWSPSDSTTYTTFGAVAAAGAIESCAADDGGRDGGDDCGDSGDSSGGDGGDSGGSDGGGDSSD